MKASINQYSSGGGGKANGRIVGEPTRTRQTRILSHNTAPVAVLTSTRSSHRHAEAYRQPHTHTHVIIMRNGRAAARSVQGQHASRTVVIWESLSEQEKESWLEESSTMPTGSSGASQKKGWSNFAHLTSAGKKSFLTMMKQKSKEERNKKNGSQKIEYRRQSIRYRSWWRQGILKNDSK